MWDLDSIVAQNNQAAIDYMMRGREVDIAQSPQPKAWSLSLLAQKLRVGPPALAILLQSFTNYETLETFLSIIRRYLPEYEDEILSAAGGQRGYSFCYHFGRKYFPLPPYAFNSTLEQLTTGLPVELMAMSYSAYHELAMRRGYLLLLSLVIYPYEGHYRDQEDDDGGARVPLIDRVQQLVGTELAGLIPRDGWMPEELHRWTDGTQYDGVGTFADWVCSQTGCIILDYSYNDCEYIEGMAEPIFQWSQFNVDELTKEYPKVKQVREKIDCVVEWLEADPIIRFRELIEFLTAKARTRHKKATKRDKFEYDETEHWCPLDMVVQYEDEEEENAEDEGEGRLRRATADDIELATQF